MRIIPPTRTRAVWRRVALLYGSVLALEIAPRLHHLLHVDCDNAQHQCVVTALLQGRLDVASPAEVGLPASLGILLPPRRARSELFFRFRIFSLGRAPPSWR